MLKKVVLLIVLLTFYGIVILFSCKKHDNNSGLNYGKIFLTISHRINSQPIMFDTAMYMNQATNVYGIEKLQYYISNIRMYKGSKLCVNTDDVFYIDARTDTHKSISLKQSSGFETGTYDSITFIIGLDSSKNISNGLTQTLENINMAWPDVMGGGYHFLKLEGHWKYSGSTQGYALHLGQNGFQAYVTVPCSLTIPAKGDASLNVTMNVNEWFANPYTYDFSTDGVFTMGDTVLMKKIAANGHDVFYQSQY